MATDNTKAIKELLEVISNKVGKIETRQSLQSAQIEIIKDQQSVVNEKLDNLESKVDTLSGDVKEIQENVDAARGDIESLHMDVKGIREKESLFHSRNKREIDEIKTHLGMPLMPDTPQV